ncbi:MAG TPA: hypothetical protein VGW12_17805 [Pyrinomonadaceae bacterium]|nr:hypothetical protein [Pyrinomonadaceae bacterium]
MKELGNNLAQLAAIIMLMITLAISTAALSLWAGSDADTGGNQSTESTATTNTMSASVNH